MTRDTWILEDEGPAAAAKYETLFALANGYRCLRGENPFLATERGGSFIAGVFDKSDAQVLELVNAPDPQGLKVYLDYEAVQANEEGAKNYKRTLDMERGLVESAIVFKSKTGNILELRHEKFVSIANVHRWAERITFKALNFSRRILMESTIDGTGCNAVGHPLDCAKHYEVSGTHGFKPGICLSAVTNERRIEIAEASVIACEDQGACLNLLRLRQGRESITEVYELKLEQGREVTVWRFGATFCSRETPGFLAGACERELASFRKDGYCGELSAHEKAWHKKWDAIDVRIEGDDLAQRSLRFNLFHLASSAPSGDSRSSIGAKGLHGEGYKGHVFWDTETFMFPFFLHTQAEVARDLLLYRFMTLEGARANAAASGCQGARFAWESADDGIETTPRWGVDYAGNHVRIWTGDIEVHINADISYAILAYYRATGDRVFMKDYGLQMLLEIARFWAGFVKADTHGKSFSIKNVIGPDEFHEHVDDNAYTNYLVRWAFGKTLEIAGDFENESPDSFAAIMERSGTAKLEFRRWKEVSEGLLLPKDEDTGVIEQFSGYFGLKEYPIREWDENDMPIWPAGLDVSKLGETTLIKQPDVVMLFAMLPEEFPRESKIVNYDFYEARTMHKSSLSPSIYSMVGLSLGKTSHAYRYFLTSIRTDLDDNQGNASLGIHAASMGGAWQSAVFGFGGFSLDAKGIPQFDPWLPEEWTSLSYAVKVGRAELRVRVSRESIRVESDMSLKVVVAGREIMLESGTPGTFPVAKCD